MKKLPLIKDLLVFVVLNVAIFGLVYLCCVGGPGLMNWWANAICWGIKSEKNEEDEK